MASIAQILWLASLLLCLHGLQATSRTLNDEPAPMVELHERWMAQYGRSYIDAAEKELRFKIFRDNVERVESFNSAGKKPYKLGINAFADMTNDEFRASRNGLKPSKAPAASATTSFRYENATALPSSIDWRKKGAVTPIKDQGQCGSCWAFSAVAATEGITKITTNKLVSLSEQELLNCDTKGRDEGCSGGYMEDAFKFIEQNGGLTTESNYPYTGSDYACDAKKEASHAATITGHEVVPANNEKALLKAVANQPVSVSIDAGGDGFQFYMSGVFTGECGTDLDHGVAAVGYGTAGDGTKYWLVKNSWGASWGEDGYIRMERDVGAKEGLCGIAMDASYPIA